MTRTTKGEETGVQEKRRKEEPTIGTSSNRSIPLPGLRAARQKQGYTQRGLAQRAGVGPSTVAELETGRRGAYPRTARRLADGLGTSVKDLAE